MKRALYFTTKLNSRDIKKCNCFWIQAQEEDVSRVYPVREELREEAKEL